MNDLEQLDRLKRAIDDANESLESFIARRWPIGSPITWMRRANMQYGEVVNIGLGKVKVRNDLSGRSYWIDIYWVSEALKESPRSLHDRVHD